MDEVRRHIIDEYPCSVVTSDGRVLNAYGRERKMSVNKRSGFLQFGVYLEGGKYKLLYLHRLVARYFVDNPNGYTNVCHRDGNKENNNASNLYWSDGKKRTR